MSFRSFHIQRIAMLIIAVLSALMFGGCHTTEQAFPRIINEPAPLPEPVRARMGVIGLLPMGAETNIHFSAPADRAEVFGRVALNTFKYMDRNSHGGHGIDGAAGKVAVSTIAALTGAALAAIIEGVPEAEFDRSHAALKKALADVSLSAGIQHQLTEAVAANRVPQVVVLSPNSVTNLQSNGRATDLSPLGARGVDSLMDISVVDVGFELKSGFNPDLSFAPQVAVHVRRVADGAVLHVNYLEYRGAERKFTGWAANDAHAFRAEVGFAEREFARAILQQYMTPSGEAAR